jgi:hypothetical protein
VQLERDVPPHGDLVVLDFISLDRIFSSTL